MKLKDTAIRNARPREKSYKLTDGQGLYLQVNPNGSKWWRFKYRFGGKEKLLSLGVYPDVGLKEARKKREEARKLRASGVDPSAHRQATKRTTTDRAANSFETVAREWHAKFSPKWTSEHAQRIIRRLERNIFPWLGGEPIGEIKAPAVLAVLRRIEARGVIDTAHRALQNCGQIFRYAVATGRAERDPSGDLRGALSPASQKHHASITDPRKIGDLLRAIDGYEGSFITRCALKLAPLVFVRPGELRSAEWAEFNLDKAEWRIPSGKMKMGEQHIVPLSQQAVVILRELHPLTGSCRYVFPGERTRSRPMSENTINAALRRLGFNKDEMTGHGFRSMASTILHEQGWSSDVIERQLAHAERNNVKAAYNFAQHLPERRRMMQAWADYLDAIERGADVIPLRPTGGKPRTDWR